MMEAMMPMVMPMVMQQLRDPEAQAQLANMIAGEFERVGIDTFEVEHVLEEGDGISKPGTRYHDYLWLHDGIMRVLESTLARFDVPLLIDIEALPDGETRRFIPKAGK